MGFASYLEDITDCYYENAPLGEWLVYLGPKAQRRDIEEAKFLFGDPLERPRRLIRDFWSYYHQQRPAAEFPAGRWELHFQNIQALHRVLAPIRKLTQKDPDAWERIKGCEAQLRRSFQDIELYGPLSRCVFQRVLNISKAINARCTLVVRELNQFHKSARAAPVGDLAKQDIDDATRRLIEIQERLGRDLQEMAKFELLAEETQQGWDHFLRLSTVLAIKNRYRPALQALDRFHLNEVQERYVTLDYNGAYRIQGASGSGKTIILIHRALRLARENTDRQVRIFTINRALAELLRSSVIAIHGQIPANLHIAAFYDFLLECIGMFESTEKYRLIDERSRERIALSWRDFYRHRGVESYQNVFADARVRDLVEFVWARGSASLDVSRYLRRDDLHSERLSKKR